MGMLRLKRSKHPFSLEPLCTSRQPPQQVGRLG